MDKPKILQNIEPMTWVGPDDEALEKCGLPHYAHIPTDASLANPVPLVLLVHGWAGDESSMWLFKQTIPSGVAIVAPRAPIALPEGGFIWFEYGAKRLQATPEALHEARQQFGHFLNALPALYPIDPLQVLLVGFSQGGMMCNDYIINNPDKALGVGSLASAVIDPPPNPQANQLAGVPVFIAHGERDDVIPVAQARLAHRIFTALGADITYGEYPAAHKMHTEALKEMKSWMGQFFPKE